MSIPELSIKQNKLKYIECEKRGYHYGQFLNMVCIEPSCLENIACCCACIQEAHKDHQTKPLKVVIKQAKIRSEKLKHSTFDIAKVMNIINESQIKTLQSIQNKKKQMIESLDKIQKSVNGYYNSIIEKVKIKSSDPKKEVENAFNTIYSDPSTQDFTIAVKKLAALIPSKAKQASSPSNPQQQEASSQQEILDSIQSATLEISQLVEKTIGDLNKNLTMFKDSLQKNINSKNIWECSLNKFKFSPKEKHINVKLTNELTAKSINTSGYKFAIMEPGLEKNIQKAIKTFSFKIKQCTSNWVAVGMCHKNIVIGKNYGFNFGGIGHGGYLVSANGGSWSNIRAQFNNSIKSFKFAKGDIITMTVNLEKNKVSFKKKGQTYELEFKKIEGDELYPCALFYYINDQIEFLPNHKDQ